MLAAHQINKKTGSHPDILFKKIPVVEGPLNRFEKRRNKILQTVVARTVEELSDSSLELLLSEVLYYEKLRLKKNRRFSLTLLFTYFRRRRDRLLLNRLQKGIISGADKVCRKTLLEDVVTHYAQEIGGHFSMRVYKFATVVLPWALNWFLNALSVHHFLPWKTIESLESRIRILGNVPHLQKLAQKGTILLVPTHQSNIDSIIIGYIIYLMSLPPFCYGAGLNLFTNPLLSFFMSNLGAYTVDRQKGNTIYKAALKNYSTEILKEGVHSIFFPGGGRSRDGSIESQLKLGLLGTTLDAQIDNLKENKERPNIYVVPVVMSYHFVLEASSLVEGYLSKIGKHRFLGADTDEPWQLIKVLKFFVRFFSTKNTITVRVGTPLDVFGNKVDEEGRSIGPNNTIIDPAKWLTSSGELGNNVKRDRQYVGELGKKLVGSYYKENTVLTSHVVAFSFMIALRKKYPDLDLYRFLRLSKSQRTIKYNDFFEEAKLIHRQLKEVADRKEIFLSEELKTDDDQLWIKNGLYHLGSLHDAQVVKARNGLVWTEDMNLVYYYRNRLSGYGLSLLRNSKKVERIVPGELDERGFLA